MFFLLTADLQCDFGSYLFTRGGDKRGKHHETKWRKKVHRRERETVGKESEKGEIIQERQQIPRGRSQRGAMMEMNGERQLGEPNQ